MKNRRTKQATAMLLSLAFSSGTAAFANGQPGGYYYSLSHPDFGQNVEKESRYRPDDGYYSSISHKDMGNNVESEGHYRTGDGYYAFMQNDNSKSQVASNSSTQATAGPNSSPASGTQKALLSTSARRLDDPTAATATENFAEDQRAMENAAQQAQIAAAQAQSAAQSSSADAADRAAQAGDAAKRAAQAVADKAYALQQAAWQAAQDAERKAEEARALLETANKARDAAEQAAQAAVIQAQHNQTLAASPATAKVQAANSAPAVTQAANNQLAQLPPPAIPVLPPTITEVLPVKDVPASFDALMNAGRDEFRQQAYHAARDTFEQAAQKQPMNQDAHFWLAMAYWHLYDYENAKDQLELTFRLNPFDTEGQVAKSRLPDIAAYLDKQGRSPVDSSDQLQQTMHDVSHQARSLQAQQFMNGEFTANSRTRLAAIESNKIRRQTGEYLASAWSDAHYYGYEPSNLDEVSDLGFINAHYAITDGFVQAQAARTDAANRMTNVSDWQNYLLSSLGDQPRPGQPRLRAFGTNLYVQYYGDQDPSAAPLVADADPELKAVALKYQPPTGTVKPILLDQAYRNLKNPSAK